MAKIQFDDERRFVIRNSLELLVGSLSKATFAIPIITLVISWLSYEFVPFSWLLIWCLSACLLSVARYSCYKKIRQNNFDFNKKQLVSWFKNIYTIDFFTGIVIGFSAVLIHFIPGNYQWLILLLIATFSANGALAHAPFKASFFFFSIPLYILAIVSVLLQGALFSVVLTALLLINFGFVYGLFSAVHKNVRKNLQLTFQNQKINQTLQQKNAALELSEKQLKVANEAKSNFIAEISQVFRVPLANLATILRINTAQSTYYQMKSTIELASTSVETMLSELDELIAIKSLAFGMVKKSEVSFNVREHFDRVMKQFAEHAISKNLRSYCFIRTQVPLELKADIKHIDQMVQNLLSNALKFTDKGYISLVVDFEAARDSNQLIIAVNDTGVGIEADKIDYIFQPFVKSTQAFEQGKGKGLGLTFCQQIVQSLNGEISVRSEPNKLTTFTVKIPVAIAKLVEKVPFDLKQKRIVIVEQNQLAKQELVERVSFFATPYITLDKAKDALAVCAKEKNNVALVIIGRQEPLQAKLLINLTQRLSIPCVVLSPLPQAEQNNKLLTHLTYPLCHHELAQILTQYYSDSKNSSYVK